MPYSESNIAAQFLRQFPTENGKLVYRRHGRGPAYPVSQDETDGFLADYMRGSRRLRVGMAASIAALGAAGGWALSAMPQAPSELAIALVVIAVALVVVSGFVWLTMRTIARPERVLAASRLPSEAEYDRAEWSRMKLAETPWLNFVIVPLAGLFAIAASSREIDVMHGTGRLAWALPLVLGLLRGASGAGRDRRRSDPLPGAPGTGLARCNMRPSVAEKEPEQCPHST